MTIKKQLEDSLKEAMKAKDDERKKTLRLALSSITLAEKEKISKLDDQAIISILQKEIKIRQDSISESKDINRTNLIAGYNNEIKILSSFLPEQLSEDQIRTIVNEVITEIGATNIKEMGKVMKISITKIQGKAPNNIISNIVKEELNK